MKRCLLKILDEINCVFIGLETNDLTRFCNQYSPFVDGYFFSKKFKLGLWDGKISFFHKTGKTFVHLLPDIIPELRKAGYKIDLLDQRKLSRISVPLIDENYFKDFNVVLGEHQVNAVNAVTKDNGGIILAGVGSGKTFCTAVLCDLYNRYCGLKTITIVPSTDLIIQTRETFERFNLDVGEYSGKVKDVNHQHVISDWQALSRNPKLLGLVGLVCVDECHGTSANVLKTLLNTHGAHLSVRIGVTGTLPESEVDKLSVKVTLGVPKYIITADDLIKSGWLAQLNISVIELEENKKEEYKQWKKENPTETLTYVKYLQMVLPDYDSEKRYLNTNDSRIRFIAGQIELNGTKEKKGNSFVLVNSVAVGKKIARLIPNSHFLYGKDKSEFRKEVYKLFEEQDNVVVIATAQLASTGLNIPRIFYLYLIDIGKSYIRTIQSIGRGLRKASDKSSIEVIDFCSNLKYNKQHQNKRIEHYKHANYPYYKIQVNYEKQQQQCTGNN